MQVSPFSIKWKRKESSLLQLSFPSPQLLQCREFMPPFNIVQCFSSPHWTLPALEILRSSHTMCYFPFRGEWRLRSKRNLESSSCPAKYPDVSTKPNQLHLLIIRRKSERRRNLRILSKWKLRMKSTHPSQSRPPYTFTYVKKSTKISLPDSIVIIIATSIRCELQMLRIYFLASVWGSKGTRPRLVPLQL